MNSEKVKVISKKLIKLRAGFTVVELIIAMGLFVVLISIVSGSFINALRTQRRIVALVAANDNANIVLEQMAREIRTGSDFDLRFDLRSDGDLIFTNYKDERITYHLALNEGIERGVGNIGSETFKKITADNVGVKSLHFTLCDPLDCPTPRITLSVGVSPREASLQDVVLNMQTTISARF